MTVFNTISAKAAGAWRDCIPSVRVAGAWVAVQQGWVKIAGTWTQFYAAVSVAISGATQTDSVGGGTASVTYYLTSGGKEQYSLGLAAAVTIGDWVVPNAAASGFDARMTMTGGTTFSSGSGDGVWLNLGTNRSWAVSRSTAGTKQATATLEIRDATTLAVVASGTIDLTAERF